MAHGKLKILVTRHANHDELIASGDLSEHARAGVDAVPCDLKNQVLVDLYALGSVNSLGIRDWTAFMEWLTKGRAVVLKRCPPLFVRAAAIIPAVIGNAHVKSVCRGYTCRANHYVWREMETDAIDVDTVDATVFACASCGAPMAPEDPADEFFAFLSD